MGSLELSYALPVSTLSIESQVTLEEDSVLGGGVKRTPQTSVSMEVGAATRNKTLAAHTGVLFNTKVELSLTDDGRLKSTSVDSGGELGKVVLGVAGLAATAVGLVSPGKHAVLPMRAMLDGKALHVEEEELKEETPEEKIERAFREANGEIANLRDRYVTLITEVSGEIAEIAEQLAKTDDAAERRALLGRLRYLNDLLPVLRAELDKLNEIFRAWRASTIKTRQEAHQLIVDLDAIRNAEVEVDNGEVSFGREASEQVRSAWFDLGVAVVVAPGCASNSSFAEAARHENAVLVRAPRWATMNVYEKVRGRAVLRESKPHLVMDSYCETKLVKLRKSVWAKRSVAIGFSDLGAMTSYKHQADSSAAAAFSTLDSLPGTVSGSLEEAAKIRKQVSAFQSTGLEEELARVKQEVELKEKELTRAGLAATENDRAKLERLKQRAELLQQRKSIRDSQPPAPAQPPNPTATEIANLKQQVELLKLQSQMEKLSAAR